MWRHILGGVYNGRWPSAAAPIYGVAFADGVAARMRDGVVLRADIYHPKADGKFAGLLRDERLAAGSPGTWAQRFGPCSSHRV